MAVVAPRHSRISARLPIAAAAKPRESPRADCGACWRRGWIGAAVAGAVTTCAGNESRTRFGSTVTLPLMACARVSNVNVRVAVDIANGRADRFTVDDQNFIGRALREERSGE